MANRYSRIFHHISTQDLKRNQKEELRLRKIEDNKVLIEEEKKEVIRKELATKTVSYTHLTLPTNREV